jgi:hypothetical protein
MALQTLAASQMTPKGLSACHRSVLEPPNAKAATCLSLRFGRNFPVILPSTWAQSTKYVYRGGAGRDTANLCRSDCCAGEISSSNCRECLVEVSDDVSYIFDAYRDAHHAVGDPDLLSSLLSQCGVSHGGGMGDQRFHSAQRFAE